jgi:hypothetical protein
MTGFVFHQCGHLQRPFLEYRWHFYFGTSHKTDECQNFVASSSCCIAASNHTASTIVLYRMNRMTTAGISNAAEGEEEMMVILKGG